MKPLYLSILGLGLASTPVFASDIDDVLVTGTRTNIALSDTPITAYKIDTTSLREQGITDVIEALKRIPSLSITQTGGRGTLTQVRIRGQEANHVLVLLDGMRLNDPVTGFVDFANLRLNGIERIEVVPGAQSLIYGGDASGGVVHLISRQADRFALEADYATGSNNLEERSTFGSISGGPFSAMIRHSKASTEGTSAAAIWRGNLERDRYQSEQNHARITLDISSLKLSYQQRNGSHFAEFDTDDFTTGLPIDEPVGFNNRQHRNDEEALSKVDWHISSSVNLVAQRSEGTYRSETQSYSPGFPNWGIPAGMQPYNTHGTSRRDSAYIRIRGGSQQLTLGVDKNEHSVTTSFFLPQSAEDEAGYVEWSGQFGRINVNAGVRHDRSDEFGNETTYRGAASFAFNDNFSIRSSLSTGFNPPTLFEMYDFGGNPDLSAEYSESIDLGFDYEFDHGTLTVVLFDQRTDDLIRSVGAFPNSRMENVDRSAVQGIELTGLWNVSEHLSTELSVTTLKAREFRPDEQDAIRVPEQTAYLSADWQLNSRLSAGASVHYYGERTDYNWALATNSKLEAYASGAAYIRLEMGSHFALTARVDNLWDEQYELVEGYGSLGRTVIVRAELRI